MPSRADAETRSANRPRPPSRERGLARYAALLDAAEALLQEASPDQIGLYQIAEMAGVPPASVYHFFPTKEAAYHALAERYLTGLLRLHGEPIPARSIGSWRDLLEIDVRRAMAFNNERPAMLKILYGGYGGVEARNLDIVITDQMAMTGAERLNLIFHVPASPDLNLRARLSLGILDSIWTISVRVHGCITEAYCEEALRAVLAYRRLYLPDFLEPRPLLLEAAAAGASVRLPYIKDPPENSGRKPSQPKAQD